MNKFYSTIGSLHSGEIAHHMYSTVASDVLINVLRGLFSKLHYVYEDDYMSGNLPCSFVGAFPLNQDLQQAHTTRQSDLLYIPRYSSKYAQKLPEYLLPKIWNKWARSVPQNSSRNIIKNTTKSKLLMSYPENVKCENVRCIECHRRQ